MSNISVATFNDCMRKLAAMKKASKELMADRAYEELKWQILNGEIGTGQLFTEHSICELLDIGRSPVRSALSKLQHDRLVDIIPRKGMLVRGISSKEVNEIVQVRLAIEPLVARLAVQNATDEDIQTLEKLLDQAENSGLKGRGIAMRVDHEFHIALAKATGNAVLTEVVSFVKKRSSMLWFRSLVTEEKMKEVQQEHRNIVEAIKRRDEKKAVKFVTEHISKLEDMAF